MKIRFWGVSLVVLAGLLSACDKKSDSNESVNAATPQSFPAPGINFYSDANYTNVDIDDSIYFGNRNAVLYYLGGSFAGRNPNTECNQFMRAGRNGPPPIAFSRMGGFENRWRAAGTRRYGRVNSRRGDTLGHVQQWKLRDGKNLTQLAGGCYVICLIDKNRRHDAMGIFFEANAQMQTHVSVNMSFQNHQAQFSQTYFGQQFKPAARGEIR